MNLRDLHYLVTVAETLHFGQAAVRCHVSQPTLSMQLKKLEETLGVQLFERSNKQVRLTDIGTDIAIRAARVLDEVAQMKQAATAARDPESGKLRLGIFPTLAPYLLPHLMPPLSARFPHLALQLVEEKTPALMEQLGHGALDAALLALPVEMPGITVHELFSEPFLLAVSTRHALARRKSVRFSDLHALRMLLLEDGHCLRDQALAVCQLAGAHEGDHFRATSLETLRYMVAAGDAATLIPKLATLRPDGGLAYLAFRDTPPHRTIGLCWRQTSARAPLFHALAAVISEAYRRAVDGR